jgi:prepilin-type N-terminal cleavage/methylation domain-containing protein
MRRRIDPRSERGLTLVELSVVILLIGLVMGVAIPAAGNLTRANLKVAAQRLAGSMRFAYDLAARKNATFRLVFDIDNRAYWLESTSERFLLERDPDEVRRGAVETEAAEKRRKRFVSRAFIESEDLWKPKGPPPFAPVRDKLAAKVELPDGIFLRDVWVSHQSDKASAGQAVLYFFPTGRTERAAIHLVDEDDNAMTVVSEPLTGRARVYSGYREIPED